MGVGQGQGVAGNISGWVMFLCVQTSLSKYLLEEEEKSKESSSGAGGITGGNAADAACRLVEMDQAASRLLAMRSALEVSLSAGGPTGVPVLRMRWGVTVAVGGLRLVGVGSGSGHAAGIVGSGGDGQGTRRGGESGVRVV